MPTAVIAGLYNNGIVVASDGRSLAPTSDPDTWEACNDCRKTWKLDTNLYHFGSATTEGGRSTLIPLTKGSGGPPVFHIRPHKTVGPSDLCERDEGAAASLRCSGSDLNLYGAFSGRVQTCLDIIEELRETLPGFRGSGKIDAAITHIETMNYLLLQDYLANNVEEPEPGNKAARVSFIIAGYPNGASEPIICSVSRTGEVKYDDAAYTGSGGERLAPYVAAWEQKSQNETFRYVHEALKHAIKLDWPSSGGDLRILFISFDSHEWWIGKPIDSLGQYDPNQQEPSAYAWTRSWEED